LGYFYLKLSFRSTIVRQRSLTRKPGAIRLHRSSRDSIQEACQSNGAQKLGGRPTGFRQAPLVLRQPVCKPGSGWHADSVRIRDGHSSGTPVTRRLKQPTRTAGSGPIPRPAALARERPRTAPIRSCSRWGLPCRRRCRRRGALLPHRFTLTAANTQRAAAVCSLWHYPWARTRRMLSGTVCPRSPDFPPRRPSLTLPRKRER